jgi:hypothetical protein
MADKAVSDLENEDVSAAVTEQLKQRVQELELQIADRDKQSEKETLVRTLDAELSSAHAIDVEAARLLALASLEGENADVREVARVVRELRERKPRIFETTRREGSMGPMRSSGSDVELAAERAMETGNRRALLEYLRLRRK